MISMNNTINLDELPKLAGGLLLINLPSLTDAQIDRYTGSMNNPLYVAVLAEKERRLNNMVLVD